MELPDFGVAGFAIAAAITTIAAIAAAAAYITFRILRKTVRMAFRMAIIAAVLAATAFGIFSLWLFGGENTEKPKPARVKRSR